MLETVVQAVINGLLIGGIYALVSIGVTLIFGVVKIVNFAQGEFVMIGMYISFFLANQFGIDPLLSLFVSMPVLFVIGVLVQHFLIRRVLGPNDMPQIFLTFALSLLLLNLALMPNNPSIMLSRAVISGRAGDYGEALSTLDVSSGYAAMAPGGKVKFGPDGKNIYGHPVGVQWQNGDLASVFPDADKRAPLMKS